MVMNLNLNNVLLYSTVSIVLDTYDKYSFFLIFNVFHKVVLMSAHAQLYQFSWKPFLLLHHFYQFLYGVLVCSNWLTFTVSSDC